MGISKIKSVHGNGSYQSKFDGSIMYTFDIELEDGAKGAVSAKTENRWQIGDEVEYSITKTDFGDKLKLNKPNMDFGNTTITSNSDANYQSRQDIITNQWAIGRALEWEMNQKSPDKVDIRQAIALAKQIKTYALDLDNFNTSQSAPSPDPCILEAERKQPY